MIRLRAVAIGPTAGFDPWLALDTGATRTVLSEATAQRLGFDLTRIAVSHRARTPAGDLPARRVRLPRLVVLGLERAGFEVLVHPFNPRSRVAGLLGRDFFAGHILTVDFARSVVRLRRPWGWPFGPRRLP